MEESAGISEVVKMIMPDLVGRVGSIRLEREIVMVKQVNNYCEEGWTLPRYRGGQKDLAGKLLANKAIARLDSDMLRSRRHKIRLRANRHGHALPDSHRQIWVELATLAR